MTRPCRSPAHAGARNLVSRMTDRGLTLIELLMVITIMGILSAIAAFSLGGLDSKSQTEACKTDAATIRAAETAYYNAIDPTTGVARHVYAPTVSTLLAADNMSSPSKWHEVVTRKVTLPDTDPTPFKDPITGLAVTLLGATDTAVLINPKPLTDPGGTHLPVDNPETRDDGTFFYLITKGVPVGKQPPCIPDLTKAATDSFSTLRPAPSPIDVTKPWLLTLQNSESVL